MVLYFLIFLTGALLSGLIVYLRMKTRLLEQMQKFTEDKNQIQIQLLNEQSKLENSQNSLVSQSEQQKQLSLQFELLAQKILDEKSKNISEQNRMISEQSFKTLSTLLDPLKERIKDFEKKVNDTYSQERAERGVLRGELGKLMELNQLMSQEAKNLTLALKGENKSQGNWGELILDNILERSGLRKGEEYTVQGSDMSLKNVDGKEIRPDVIVNLPEGKHLIIDSKMTLNAYEGYCNADSADDQERFAKLHVESLKRHIDGLSEKKYHSAEQLITPDYVILFMPLEPAFALAFKLKPDLFQYAWEKNIAIVSPTTLLTTLRTVSALWKQDRQEKNALEIARRGGLLYDKFVGFMNDLVSLGKKLDDAQKSHQDVLKKLSEGKGNLIDQVEELKTLGAKTEKQLPQIQ